MAVDPSRALAPRPAPTITVDPCPVCRRAATHWSDGWVDCPVCGIYDPTDMADTLPLRQAERDRRRDREREAGDG